MIQTFLVFEVMESMAHINTRMVRHISEGIAESNTTVSHHEDPQEAVDDPGEVEDNSHPAWPARLEEHREQHSLHRAAVLPSTDGLQGVNVADVGVVTLPVTLHTFTLQKYCSVFPGALNYYNIISM